MDNGEFLSY